VDKKELNQKIRETVAEIERLTNIIDEPERILSDFYDSYKPNLLQRVLEIQGYTEDELYEVLIMQIGKLPALSNCRITRTSNEPMAPMRVKYKDPDFELVVMDIKSKKYESVFESVAKGLIYRMRDAEVYRDQAQKNVNQMKAIDSRIRTILGGEIPLRHSSWSKRGALKQYMASLNYPADEIKRVLNNPAPFLAKIEEEIDKRQSILAEQIQEYSECAAKKESFENNPYLQNAVRDLTELLQNSGYTSKPNMAPSS
jgi:hypothetical protein